MNFEIDFLPVGDLSSSGDAIAFRVGNLSGPRELYKVVVVDGGTQASGQSLVQHIQTYYNTNDIDLAILTHPDKDHAAGLKVVMEQMNVKELAMHLPWDYGDDIVEFFQDGRLTANSVSQKLAEALTHAREIYNLATNNSIPVRRLFEGESLLDGVVQVLGPSEVHYVSMLQYFRSTPESVNPMPLIPRLQNIANEAIQWVAETLDFGTERLTDELSHWSAENSSSSVLLLNLGDKQIILTGDADQLALEGALDYAESIGVNLANLHIFQAPHHGSKHNIGTTILNRIFATNVQVSAATQGPPKHPSRQVINAFVRRGMRVYSTEGKGVCHHDDYTTPRTGWVTATPLPFNELVEA